MFEKKDIDAYQNLKAPSALRERILASSEMQSTKKTARVLTDPRLIKRISAVAACFLLVMTIFGGMLMGDPSAVVMYEGESVSEHGLAVAAISPLAVDEPIGGRSMAEIQIPLAFTSEKPVTVIVTNGLLYETDENGDLLGEQTEICGETYLLWVLDADTAVSELTVKRGLHKTVYGLEMTEDSPIGMIYRK